MSLIPPQRLQSIIDRLPAPQPGVQLEVEVRFGYFNGTNFISDIGRRVFSRVRDSFQKLGFPGSYTHTVDRIYRGQRFTTEYDSTGAPLRNYRVNKQEVGRPDDFLNYSFRIDVSTEQISDASPPEAQPELVRDKKRWSFVIRNQYRLDLTRVTSTRANRRPEMSYEVELEVLPPHREGLQGLERVLNPVLTAVQGTLLLWTQEEKEQVIGKVNEYLGSRIDNPWEIDNTILAQARNLKVRDLTLGGILPRTNRDVRYTVTIKADGVRRLLVFTENGVYLVYPPDDINKILPRSVAQRQEIRSNIGTVIEGELIPNENLIDPELKRQSKLYFLMYDILASGVNPEIRKESLFRRLQHVQTVAKNLQGLSNMHFLVKEFYPAATGIRSSEEFYESVRLVLDQIRGPGSVPTLITEVPPVQPYPSIDFTRPYPFLTDGLIFTPDTYYVPVPNALLSQRTLDRYPEILKWKPPSQLTIDLEVQRGDDGDVQLLSSVPTQRSTSYLRDVGDVYSWLANAGRVYRAPFIGSDQFPFDPRRDLVTNDILMNAPDGSILEFEPTGDYVDVDAGDAGVERRTQLRAVRARPEKVAPNSLEVVLDVWKDIHSPLSEATVRGEQFKLVFNFHNQKKRELFKYVGRAVPDNGAKVLLDVGSGRGGDVFKWIQAGFTHVICVEPDESNRLELQRRLAGRGIQYLIVPTTGQDVMTIVQAVRTFSPYGAVHAVSYMLSLSFFFDSPESSASVVRLVDETLMHGGYFLAFSIDGRKVIEFFNTPGKSIADGNIYKAYFTMIDFQLRLPYEIYVNIPNSIVRNQTEWLTNLSGLIELLKRTGVELIKEEPSDSSDVMTEEERDYGRLFTGIVARRN